MQDTSVEETIFVMYKQLILYRILSIAFLCPESNKEVPSGVFNVSCDNHCTICDYCISSCQQTTVSFFKNVCGRKYCNEMPRSRWQRRATLPSSGCKRHRTWQHDLAVINKIVLVPPKAGKCFLDVSRK